MAMSQTVRGRGDAVRVLHVDDDDDFLGMASAVFEDDERFEHLTESSVDDAIDRLQSDEIDCLVSDSLRTPDGEAFVVAARETAPRVPLVLFTAKEWVDVATDAHEAGAAGFVRKASPDQFETLFDRIDQLATVEAGADEFTRGGSDISEGGERGVRTRGSDRSDWRVAARHDWERDDLSTSIVDVAEEVIGDVPTSPTLYRSVDAELVEEMLGGETVGTRVVFEFHGREFLVADDGTIAVRTDD
jgi:CheY-like chemotaxis protein